MARYHQSVCRLCRLEGEKLFLKGDRCFKEKCALEKRNVPPGQHGKRRGKLVGYGAQLREKQKVKRIYGVLEKQFRNYFHKASLKKGITGEILLSFLEKRIDNDDFINLMKISKRTAQTWRDNGAISFSQIGSKIYYKTHDIEDLLHKHYNPAKKL